MTDPARPELSQSELIRYSRHLLLPGVGLEGQQRLKAARVLIVGAGGLGSPSSMYLAAAGIGTIGLVDFDRVDLSNLQRQVIHDSSGIGKPKLDSAVQRLRGINPHVDIRAFATRLTSENALEILGDFDISLDGSDNFPTRYLINDACVLLGKPYVYGSILRFDGQVSLFSAREGPCYRCLFAERGCRLSDFSEQHQTEYCAKKCSFHCTSKNSWWRNAIIVIQRFLNAIRPLGLAGVPRPSLVL